MSAATAPHLPAYPDGDSLRVWCAHCRTWHYHGARYGHRAAHCRLPGSPYRPSGYVLTKPAKMPGQAIPQPAERGR